MKNFHLLTGLCAVVFALAMNASCARSSGPSKPDDTPIPVGPESTATPAQVVPSFELKETYHGDVLVLQYPDDDARGSIILRGQDAMVLFTSLLSKTISGKDTANNTIAQFRYGLDLFCWKRKPETHSSLPQYVCRVDFDYNKGAAMAAPAKAKFEARDSLGTNYQGKNVTLFADNPNSLANLQLNGKDAEALFWTLQIKTVENPSTTGFGPSLTKSGKDFTCSRFYVERKKAIYICNLNFNFRTGEVSRYTATN